MANLKVWSDDFNSTTWNAWISSFSSLVIYSV